MEYQDRFLLSIQSSVAYGYVGNRAAVFPLQCMGYDVLTVNTVQLSNHPGYGDFKGDFFPAHHIAAVLEGIKDRDLFPRIEAVLSGYLGDPALGDIILETVDDIRASRGGAPFLYACDPVMGDTGCGFFVDQAIPPFFKDRAAPIADILTPNQFELEYLTGVKIKTLEDAKNACDLLHMRGTSMILLTSLEHAATPRGHIQMLVSRRNGDTVRRHIVTTPKLAFDTPPNGSGDCTAALFCGYILSGLDTAAALAHTASAIFALFEKTAKMQRRELAIIQSRHDFERPAPRFTAYAL